jgi:hypothetical protein
LARPSKKRFIEEANRRQATLSANCLDDWIDESNPFARSICSSMSYWPSFGQRCPLCSRHQNRARQ